MRPNLGIMAMKMITALLRHGSDTATRKQNFKDPAVCRYRKESFTYKLINYNPMLEKQI